jgi:epidermal growth factor receptor substrate 15
MPREWQRSLSAVQERPAGLRHYLLPFLYYLSTMRNTTELTDHYLSAQRHPNLNLTPEEKRVFYQLFQAADTTNLGVITGEIAVPFFEKTHLSPDTLGLVCECRKSAGSHQRKVYLMVLVADMANRG